MMERLRVGFGNRKIALDVRRLSLPGMAIGLMFRTKNTKNLLFDQKGTWGIHSFFVFFDFLALWLDDKNKVIEWKIVKPFASHTAPKKPFARLVEIPINGRNKSIIQNFIKNRVY